jgi:hypothetical protein
VREQLDRLSARITAARGRPLRCFLDVGDQVGQRMLQSLFEAEPEERSGGRIPEHDARRIGFSHDDRVEHAREQPA